MDSPRSPPPRARSPPAMRWARWTASPCARIRRRWRCAASPWRSSVNSRAPANCCAAPRAASAPARRSRGARCVVAEAEVALALRDSAAHRAPLDAAAALLEARGDRANALQARLIAARGLVLLGRLAPAAQSLARLDAHGLPPTLAAVLELTRAELALRALRTGEARARPRARTCGGRTRRRARPARRGGRGAGRARAPRRATPARRGRGGLAPRRRRSPARLRHPGGRCLPPRPAGRRRTRLPLARRPVLFALAQALARAWPGDARARSPDCAGVPHPPPRRDAPRAPARRDRPPARTGRAAGAHRGHRARLRARAARRAGGRGPRPAAGRRAGLAAGAAGRWRGLVDLGPGAGAGRQPAHRAARAGRTRRPEGRARIGRARARRWLAPPLAGFTTILLLPAALPHA